jgi:hypothetical protein
MASTYEVIVSSMLALGVLTIVLALRVGGSQRALLDSAAHEPKHGRNA